MVGLRGVESPSGAYPKPRAVGFAGVTGVSRPLHNDEHWTVYYFEMHATSCKTCSHPLEVARAGRRLCDEGHQLATAVAGLHLRMKSDSSVYCVDPHSHREVRVELPPHYVHTHSLFQAINRAVRAGTPSFPTKPKSLDPNYFVRKRQAAAVAPEYAYAYQQHPAPVLVPQPRAAPVDASDYAAHHRGSLYDMDVKELQQASKLEHRLRYNVEERAPSRDKSRRHSIFWG